MTEENVPLLPNGEPMSRFEVRMRAGKNGTLEKAIFIDGELLDWAVDVSSLMEAKKMGPQYWKAVQADIAKHFLEAVSDTLGRKVTEEDLKKATQTGWI